MANDYSFAHFYQIRQMCRHMQALSLVPAAEQPKHQTDIDILDHPRGSGLHIFKEDGGYGFSPVFDFAAQFL
ncbi:hypothetical protein SDC9_196913 [bioreactor metagenome]|uniref:Uncharacterized protein n=1 Tax=bioreactor metagenome TaxID=1076179 RepID=A0A645IED8_9ZZZZ